MGSGSSKKKQQPAPPPASKPKQEETKPVAKQEAPQTQKDANVPKNTEVQQQQDDVQPVQQKEEKLVRVTTDDEGNVGDRQMGVV